MTKYINQILAILVLLLMNSHINAQQTPVFSDYYYNQSILNPAHSGYYLDTEISISNFGFLNDFEGNPRTFSGIFNANFNENTVGVSGGISNDQIGVSSVTSIFGSYAYKINFGHYYNRARWWDYNPDVLSFGVTAGLLLFNENLSSLNIQGDPNFEEDVNITIPTFGLGVLYNHNRLHLGFSVQNLFSNSIANDQNINIQVPLYIYGGYKFYFTKFEEIRIQPSALIKFENQAPAQIDLNISANYKNKIEVGTGYRTTSSFNGLVGIYFAKKLRFAYSYTAYNRNTPFANTNGFILTYRSGEGF